MLYTTTNYHSNGHNFAIHKSGTMQTNTVMTEYLAFMEWLQSNHPDLYISCWKSIPEPTEGEAISIVKQGLDEKTYKAVIDAKFEYYKNSNK